MRSNKSPERFHSDGFSVTEKEALFLLAHYLRMAAIHYQNIPEGTAWDAEALRLIIEMVSDGRAPNLEDPAIPASKAFIETISKIYAQMD